jgi:hypothetical protein
MKIGTLVRCSISKVVGVVAPPPEDNQPWVGSAWVLVTHSEDDQFVGTVHSWDETHLEVLNESG